MGIQRFQVQSPEKRADYLPGNSQHLRHYEKSSKVNNLKPENAGFLGIFRRMPPCSLVLMVLVGWMEEERPAVRRLEQFAS